MINAIKHSEMCGSHTCVQEAQWTVNVFRKCKSDGRNKVEWRPGGKKIPWTYVETVRSGAIKGDHAGCRRNARDLL